MNRGGIIRIVIWIVIVLILLYFSIGYSYEVFRAEAALIDPSDTHEITVDNEDFTPVVTLLEYGVNGVFTLINQAAYAIIILIVSILLILPFRLIGLNKKRKITRKEYVIYQYSFIGVFVLALMISVILTRFTGLLTILLYNGIWAVLGLLFVVLPAKRLVKVCDIQ